MWTEFARRFCCDVSVIDERKIDQVIELIKLDKYQVSVVALQETKCFGMDALELGCCCVESWQRFPGVGQVRQRGEGLP